MAIGIGIGNDGLWHATSMADEEGRRLVEERNRDIEARRRERDEQRAYQRLHMNDLAMPPDLRRLAWNDEAARRATAVEDRRAERDFRNGLEMERQRGLDAVALERGRRPAPVVGPGGTAAIPQFDEDGNFTGFVTDRPAAGPVPVAGSGGAFMAPDGKGGWNPVYPPQAAPAAPQPVVLGGGAVALPPGWEGTIDRPPEKPQPEQPKVTRVPGGYTVTNPDGTVSFTQTDFSDKPMTMEEMAALRLMTPDEREGFLRSRFGGQGGAPAPSSTPAAAPPSSSSAPAPDAPPQRRRYVPGGK